MTFVKGKAANTTGNNGQPGRKVVTKIQKAINKAIDLLGEKAVSKCGVTELAHLISEEFKNNPVGTLKALSALLPKDVAVDVTHNKSAQALSDDALADIIAQRARARLEESKDITSSTEEIKEELYTNQ